MERLKLWLIPVYGVVGFLGLLLIIPSSRWVVLTQLDVVAGRWRYLGGNNGYMYPGIDFLNPVQRGLDEDDPASDETARFLRLVSPSRMASDMATEDDRFVALFDICKRKSDPRYWAQFVRVTSFQAQIPYVLPGETGMQFPNRRKVQIRLRDACLAGAKLDADNAFFPMMLAGVLYRLGDIEGSRQAYLSAGELGHFDDYLAFEPQIRNAYLVDHYGNRGHQVAAQIYAGTILPQLTTMISLGRFYTKPNDIEGRLATIRIGALAASQEASAIAVLEAREIMTWALAPNTVSSFHAKLSKDAESTGWKLLISQADNIGLMRAEVIYDSTGTTAPNWPLNPDAVRTIVNLQPGWSAWSLWSLVLILPALGVCWLKQKSPRFAMASPHLVWLIALPAEVVFGTAANPASMFSMAAILFIPALLVRKQKVVDILGLVIAAFALIVSFTCLWLMPVVLLFVLNLLIERRAKKMPLPVSTGLLIIACAFGSASWVAMACRLGFGTGAVFGPLTALGAFALISVREPIKWSAMAGAACLVVGSWFGVMVARDLAADQQLAVVCRKLLNDANDLRRQ